MSALVLPARHFDGNPVRDLLARLGGPEPRDEGAGRHRDADDTTPLDPVSDRAQQWQQEARAWRTAFTVRWEETRRRDTRRDVGCLATLFATSFAAGFAAFGVGAGWW